MYICLTIFLSVLISDLFPSQSHPAAKGLLNKPFPYYDELTYVFGRDRATNRFAETFADVGFNEPGEYDGFAIGDGNEEFPPVYS